VKKTIALAILCLILGLYVGRWSAEIPKSPSIIQPQEISQCDGLNNKFQELEDQAKNELDSIVDADLKIKKMQEIYGQMFQLFLANVALKLDKNFWQDIGDSSKVVIGEKRECPQLPLVESKPKEEIQETSVEVFGIEQEDRTLPNLELNGREQKESSSFSYKSGKLKNPTTYYLSSKLINGANNRIMKRIQGNFKGEALMKDPKNKRWRILMNSSLVFSNKNWTGDVNIELSDDEHGIFSRSSGQGDNNNFSQNPDDRSSIVIQASPDLFLHLKWRESRQLFNGYIYRKARSDKSWKLAGHIPYLSRE